MKAVDLGSQVVNMTKPKNQLFCRLDDLSPDAKEQLRLETLSKLGLLVSEAVPVFGEATQKAATFVETPICILGLVVDREIWFKSTVGLSTIGLMNQIAAQRKISLRESFSTFVVDSQQPLIIENTLSDRVFANSILTQHCGIRAYLGVPLIASNGMCLGTLEVMDWKARKFSDRDIEHLSLLARWCLGEFERERLAKVKQDSSETSLNRPQWQKAKEIRFNSKDNLNSGYPVTAGNRDINTETMAHSAPIKIKLLSQLTQELRTPLTSVIGMASVLHREVYGPLTIKQREYLEIIHNSGQNLISLVDEIVNLGILSEQSSDIDVSSVDIEMLCQQVINSLLESAKQQEQTLSLSIEPGNRIWCLDKEKVRQALYYLITSIIEMSEPGGEVKVHVSRRNKALNIAVGISHPWLGEGFAEASKQSQAISKALSNSSRHLDNLDSDGFNAGMSDIAPRNHQVLSSAALMVTINREYAIDKSNNKVPRDLLGLLFCCHLTEMHEGRVVVQGSVSSSYRYVLQFSKAPTEDDDRLAVIRDGSYDRGFGLEG